MLGAFTAVKQPKSALGRMLRLSNIAVTLRVRVGTPAEVPKKLIP